MTLNSIKYLSIAWVVVASFAFRAEAEPTCEISDQKKKIIADVLCGQDAAEKRYRKYGVDCARRSIETRLQDSAVQIIAYQMCGYRSFSNELRDATLRSLRLMHSFLACTQEQFSAESILKEKMQQISSHAGKEKCTPELMTRLKERRPYFEAIIKASRDKRLLSNLLERLKISIDGAGNVVEQVKSEGREAVMLKAFDALCMNTRLDDATFANQIKVVEKLWSTKSKKLKKAFLHKMSPANNIGYYFKINGEKIFVIMGRKKNMEGKYTKACSVTVDGMSFFSAQKIIELNFPVKKVDQFKQGVSEFAIYEPNPAFVFYEQDVAISIQSGLGMSTITLFEY